MTLTSTAKVHLPCDSPDVPWRVVQSQTAAGDTNSNALSGQACFQCSAATPASCASDTPTQCGSTAEHPGCADAADCGTPGVDWHC